MGTEGLEKLFKRARDTHIEDARRELIKFQEMSGEEERKKVNALGLNILYDPLICGMLGIPYSDFGGRWIIAHYFAYLRLKRFC